MRGGCNKGQVIMVLYAGSLFKRDKSSCLSRQMYRPSIFCDSNLAMALSAYIYFIDAFDFRESRSFVMRYCKCERDHFFVDLLHFAH